MSDAQRYRGDIDGLRALAVLLVVLYHLRVPGIPAGFIGVDVFFVISGFVVTRMIARDLDERTFSFKRFYVNRFWRLQPAFFLVAATTLGASYLLLEPVDLLRATKSALAAATMSANFFFWQTTSGYGSPLAEQEPFLHTWSLAVEEQFYLLWPALLVFGSKVRALKHPLLITATLLGLLGLSQYFALTQPSLAYYLLPARLMELGLGAALVRTERFKLPRLFADLARVVGLLLVLGSAALLNERSTFPGVYAAIPCVGTALLMQAGTTRTGLSSLLENRVASLLGKASYSIYLWHWAPIALANYADVELTNAVQAAIGGGTLVLGLASFRFWETPTRRAPTAVYRYLTFSVAITAAALVGFAIRPGGSIQTTSSLEAEEPSEEIDNKHLACLFATKTWADVDACEKVQSAPGRKRLLIWGDSHASVYRKALAEHAERLGYTLTSISLSGCPPIFDVHREDRNKVADACNEATTQLVRSFIDRHDFDAILLTSRFGIYEKGWIRKGRLVEATHFLSDKETRGVDAKHSAEVLKRGLSRTLSYLTRNRRTSVILALPTPVLPRAPKAKDGSKLLVTRKAYLKQRAFMDAFAKKVPRGVYLFDPIEALCDDSNCPASDETGVLYRDDNHLNQEGARRLVEPLTAVLDDATH